MDKEGRGGKSERAVQPPACSRSRSAGTECIPRPEIGLAARASSSFERQKTIMSVWVDGRQLAVCMPAESPLRSKRSPLVYSRIVSREKARERVEGGGEGDNRTEIAEMYYGKWSHTAPILHRIIRD